MSSKIICWRLWTSGDKKNKKESKAAMHLMDTTFISQQTATPSCKEVGLLNPAIQDPGNLNTATFFTTSILCTRCGA